MIKTMKKTCAALLALILAAGSFSGCGEMQAGNEIENNENSQDGSSMADQNNYDKTAEELSLPNVGDVVEGFKVIKLYDFPQRSGVIVEMEHEKTGAKAVYVANDDEDAAFNIFFRTRASNDKGIPHIFEHITLAGSDKYPNANLWDQLAQNSYVTEMNAFTEKEMTGYVVSSLSEEQLLADFDYYMDGLTSPLALHDANPLGREAYRYQLYDRNDEISVTGAVFNEMESSNASIEQVLYNELLKELFPGSCMAAVTGGVRQDIVSVTLDELNEFYDTYYNPSNMLVALYGKMDYTRFLHLLDSEYLSGKEKKETDLTDYGYEPWSGYRENTVPFPAEEGSSSEDSGMGAYAIALNGISPYDETLIDLVMGIITDESSSMYDRIQEELPGRTVSGWVQPELDTPCAVFCVENTNEGDEKILKEIIEEELSDIVKTGLDKDLVDAVTNTTMGGLLINADEHGGCELLEELGQAWAVEDGGIAGFLDSYSAQENFGEEAAAGKLESLIEEYLVSPGQSVFVNMIPEPGLYESEWNEFLEFLNEKKASMSDEELDELIKATNDFDEWSDEQSAEDTTASVICVGVDDLDTTFEEPEVEVSEEDGITYYESVIGDAGYVYTGIMLDALCVPADRVLDLQLLPVILGSVDTDGYSYDEIAKNMNRDLYDFGISLDIGNDKTTDEAQMKMNFYFTALDDKVDAGWDYYGKIINNSDFSDVQRLREIISDEYYYQKSEMADDVFAIGRRRAEAMQDDDYRLASYAQGTEYLEYLTELVNMDDEELADKAEELKETFELIKNKNGLVFQAIGDETAIEESGKDAGLIIGTLSEEPVQKVNYAEEIAEPLDEHDFAVVTPDSNNYNAVTILYRDLGFDRDGKSNVILSYVKSNVIYPKFRYDIGSYGINVGMWDNSVEICSYSDPEIEKSIDAFKEIYSEVEDLNPTVESTDAAIMSVYSDLAYPRTELDMAQREIVYRIRNYGTTFADYLNTCLKNAKSVTPKDITDSAEKFKKLTENGVYFSYGNGSKIKKSGLYDDINEILIQ